MNKIIIAGAGVALAMGATLATSQTAGAATAHKVTTTYKTIASTPTGAPPKGNCGYPVANASLTLGPSTQVSSSGGTYKFSGTYGCNGHGLANHKVFLAASFRGKTKAGSCTSTTGKTGGYGCVIPAKGSGTAQSSTQHAVSNTVAATTH